MTKSTKTRTAKKTAKATSPKKKVVKKKVVKKVVKKKVVKKAPTPSKEKKEGLRKPQVRILQALSKGKELTRTQIAEKASVDVAGCVEWIGSHDDEKRAANDKKHFPSLLSLGYVKFGVMAEINNRQVPTYAITASGNKAIQ